MARKYPAGRGDLAVTGNVHREFGYQVPRGHWGSRLAPYFPEWAGWAATWPVTWGMHDWLASDPGTLPWASAGMAVMSVGLTAVTWQCARARAAITRRFAVSTTGVATAWITAGTIAGPGSHPLLLVWGIGGSGMALAWSIYKALKRGGDGEAGDGLFERVQLAGVKTTAVEAAPNKVTARLQLPPGQMDVTDVQKATGRIASVFRLGKGSVRVTEHPEDVSQATMTIVPKDVLRNPPDWPGPSAPGGSIAEPIVVGLYEDSEPMRIYLPGDPDENRNATDYQVIGMKGSGKSHGGRVGWTEILTRRDAGLVLLDPSKGEQTVGFLGDAPYKVVIGADKCRKLVRKLPGLITKRASQLGRWGYDQWVPEVFDKHGLPFLVVWIEEAPRVLEDAKTLTRIVQEARSAGISVVLSLQKAVYRQMSTDVRSQLGGVWCFGVNEIEDAAYSLSEDTIEGGARPDRWKNRRPGCSYLEGPGIPEERYTTPGRTFNPTKEAMLTDITDTADIRPGMHPIDAEFLNPDATHTDTTSAEDVDPDTDEEVEGEDFASLANINPADAEDFDDEPLELPENPEPELPVDDERELPEETGVVELDGGRPPRKEALQRLRARVDELAAAGVTEFTVRDFPRSEATYGRGRSWVSGELDKLAAAGVLIRVGEDDRATVYRPREARTSTQGRDAA